MNTRLPSLLLLAGLACCSSAAGQVDFGSYTYQKLETRQKTEQRMLTELQQLPDVTWGDWHLLTSFPGREKGTLKTVLPPEEELARMAANGPGPDLTKTYKGKLDSQAAWQDFDGPNDMPLDLRVNKDKALNNNATCYLYRTVKTDKAVSINVTMGSDDGLRFWVNGALIVDADLPRGLDPEAHKVTLQLEPGVNHLFAKVSQGAVGWDFQMNTRRPLDSVSDAKLQYQLNKDFPTPEMEAYRVATIPVPDDISLEVGGLDVLPDGRAVVSTRRGDVYIVSGASVDPPLSPRFILFATGLHEPLGAAVGPSVMHPGWKKNEGQTAVYCVQRGELTRLVDTNRDDRADLYETVSDAWGVSGNYHEFAFGPKFDADGNAWVTLNVGFCDSLGKAVVPYRGWALKVAPDGSMTPITSGLRSPNGIGQVPIPVGDKTETAMFYADNQGDFVGTNRLMILQPGGWAGHPSSLRWRDDFLKAGKEAPPPPQPPREKTAIWLPYPKMGQSVADIVVDSTGGKFGPFAGQVFVGDQTIATVMRVALEKVTGADGTSFYQGAAFPFFKGLDCGVNRLAFDNDGAMLIGETDRGWGSVGRRRFGLQRLVFTGQTPFEIATMKAAPDGFVLTFTQDIDRASAENAASYTMSSHTYEYHQKYGSDEMETRQLSISRAKVMGPRTVHIVVDGLRSGGEGYVHALIAGGVKSTKGSSLLHKEAYYTMQVLPGRMPEMAHVP